VIHGANFHVVHKASDSKNQNKYLYQSSGVPEFATFDEFLDAFFEELKCEIDQKLTDQVHQQSVRIDTFAQPLVSIFMHDCIEKGLDMAWGGGRYNYSYPQLVGFSTLIDSLYTIQEFVFATKTLTLAQLGEILANNWVGNEILRQRIINKLPKWGNDNEKIDPLGIIVEKKYTEFVEQYEGIFPHSTFHPGYLNWLMHSSFGRELGATPDGRIQKSALSNSFAPAQGVGREGLTAICNSASKIEQKNAIGACTLNLTLLQSTLNHQDQQDKFSSLIQTYFEKGGTHVQVNVFDPNTLIEAQINPDQYPELVVKVGGFSSRFIDLEKVTQDEIIRRNGFSL
jgi:formate C-acetyltransferase